MFLNHGAFGAALKDGIEAAQVNSWCLAHDGYAGVNACFTCSTNCCSDGSVTVSRNH